MDKKRKEDIILDLDIALDILGRLEYIFQGTTAAPSLDTVIRAILSAKEKVIKEK